jgi:phenylacetate-coenzyme A ligase PaaK-like adenylate-forming protein
VIDPRSGHPVPDEEMGEIVFSTLTRSGMPLIRYRTGDLGHFIPAPCPCGTVLKTLARVTTRLDGQLPLGDGLLSISDLDEAIFPVENVLNFTAALEPDGELTRLKLDVMFAEMQSESCARIRQVVEEIPAVQNQVAAHCLSVLVDPVHVIPPQMVKRTIGDLRSLQK